MVADEVDLLDAGFLAFVDLENQIDAVVRPFDDLRHNGDVEPPVAAVDVYDPFGVGLHRRT